MRVSNAPKQSVGDLSAVFEERRLQKTENAGQAAQWLGSVGFFSYHLAELKISLYASVCSKVMVIMMMKIFELGKVGAC